SGFVYSSRLPAEILLCLSSHIHLVPTAPKSSNLPKPKSIMEIAGIKALCDAVSAKSETRKQITEESKGWASQRQRVGIPFPDRFAGDARRVVEEGPLLPATRKEPLARDSRSEGECGAIHCQDKHSYSSTSGNDPLVEEIDRLLIDETSTTRPETQTYAERVCSKMEETDMAPTKSIATRKLSDFQQ
ncbi:uncharacterized protein PV07_12687, partial [Cladophialophora immunda]